VWTPVISTDLTDPIFEKGRGSDAADCSKRTTFRHISRTQRNQANRRDDGPQLPCAEGLDDLAPLSLAQRAVQRGGGDPALLQEPRQLLDVTHALGEDEAATAARDGLGHVIDDQGVTLGPDDQLGHQLRKGVAGRAQTRVALDDPGRDEPVSQVRLVDARDHRPDMKADHGVEAITTVGRRGQTEQVARGELCNNGRYLLRRRVVRLIEDNMRDVQECWRDTSRQALHEGDRQPLAHATLTITDEANLMA